MNLNVLSVPNNTPVQNFDVFMINYFIANMLCFAETSCRRPRHVKTTINVIKQFVRTQVNASSFHCGTYVR